MFTELRQKFYGINIVSISISMGSIMYYGLLQKYPHFF